MWTLLFVWPVIWGIRKIPQCPALFAELIVVTALPGRMVIARSACHLSIDTRMGFAEIAMAIVKPVMGLGVMTVLHAQAVIHFGEMAVAKMILNVTQTVPRVLRLNLLIVKPAMGGPTSCKQNYVTDVDLSRLDLAVPAILVVSLARDLQKINV